MGVKTWEADGAHAVLTITLPNVNKCYHLEIVYRNLTPICLSAYPVQLYVAETYIKQAYGIQV